MRAVTAAAVDDGVGGGQQLSRRGEEGRGGEQCGVEPVFCVSRSTSIYLALSYEASKSLSSRLPGTPTVSWVGSQCAISRTRTKCPPIVWFDGDRKCAPIVRTNRRSDRGLGCETRKEACRERYYSDPQNYVVLPLFLWIKG